MNRHELLARTHQGEHFSYLTFFQGWLSQWYPAQFLVDEQVYRTAEHYMMAEKARVFNDWGTRNRILATSHPAEAKRLGRGVQGYDDAAWSSIRMHVVIQGNMAKFSQNHELRKKLIETGDRILVEANARDPVWGVGVDGGLAEDVRNWRGENLLGFALMHVRDNLRSGT
jgi:ribA/ribD-fused uncharacterized protein